MTSQGHADRRRIGRTLAADVPLAVLLGCVAVGATFGQQAWGGGAGHGGGPPFGSGAAGFAAQGPILSPSAYAGLAAAAVGVAMRRVWPRAALVVTSGAALGYFSLGHGPGPILWLLGFVIFSAALALAPVRLLPWAALSVPAVLAGYLGEPYLGLGDASSAARLSGTFAVFAVAAMLGLLIRAGRQSARRERAAELNRHAYAERLRIAREVHDVVGHSLSVINMQAGVALHVLDKRPEQAAPALEVIRTTSKDALDELRGTLAVFRDQAGGRRLAAPPPGLGRLDDLVAAVRGEGRTVEVRVEGAPEGVSAAVDHAAYRIAQEALTNAVRHAEHAAVRVAVDYRPDALTVEVVDDGPARPGSAPVEGNGLAGMRERAEAVGGSVVAGPREQGGFAVRARLPLGERVGSR